jgi:hypothetical protein
MLLREWLQRAGLTVPDALKRQAKITWLASPQEGDTQSNRVEPPLMHSLQIKQMETDFLRKLKHSATPLSMESIYAALWEERIKNLEDRTPLKVEKQSFPKGWSDDLEAHYAVKLGGTGLRLIGPRGDRLMMDYLREAAKKTGGFPARPLRVESDLADFTVYHSNQRNFLMITSGLINLLTEPELEAVAFHATAQLGLMRKGMESKAKLMDEADALTAEAGHGEAFRHAMSKAASHQHRINRFLQPADAILHTQIAQISGEAVDKKQINELLQTQLGNMRKNNSNISKLLTDRLNQIQTFINR